MTGTTYPVEIITQGLAFPEGPVFDPEGNLYVVNLHSGIITRVGADGRTETFVDTGGKPNGAAWNSTDGSLTVCDSGLRQILSITAQGEIRVLSDSFQRSPLAGPNDCTYDAEGNLYFTDPLGSSLDNPVGKVYCMLHTGEVRLFDDGYAFSNGIAWGPDGALYVAESRTRRIWRYVMDGPGTFAEKTLFVELEGGRGPDGMAFDDAGRLYIAHAGKGCVAVVSPEGRVVEEIPVGGASPTNVAFGDIRGLDLYVTEAESGSVYRITVGKRGLLLY